MSIAKYKNIERIRKAVDISPELQKALSYQAIEQGMSLKKYMEWSLEQIAFMWEERALMEAVRECDPVDVMTESEKSIFVNRLKATV